MKSNIFCIILPCLALTFGSARAQWRGDGSPGNPPDKSAIPTYMHPVDASYFARTCGTEQRRRSALLDAAYRDRESRVNAEILQGERQDLPTVYTLPVVF